MDTIDYDSLAEAYALIGKAMRYVGPTKALSITDPRVAAVSACTKAQRALDILFAAKMAG